MKAEIRRKYELIPGSEKNGLFRIRALIDIPGICRAGDLGGFLESESNLSQCGNCWVSGDAEVSGNALVTQDALATDEARISGDSLIEGMSLVTGSAQISGNVFMTDFARAMDKASLSGDICVEDNVRVYGNARISGKVIMVGHACISGNAIISGRDILIAGTETISGEARICGNEDYIVFRTWWNFGRYITWTRSDNMWNDFSFHGTGKELLKEKAKEGRRSLEEYKALIRYVEGVLKRQDSEKGGTPKKAGF